MLIMMVVVFALMMGPENGPMGMMKVHEQSTPTETTSATRTNGAVDHGQGAAKSE